MDDYVGIQSRLPDWVTFPAAGTNPILSDRARFGDTNPKGQRGVSLALRVGVADW
jgi:hypothetical protein